MGKLVDLLEAYPIKEIPPYKLYCDMDGVLTDFKGRFEYFTGKTPDEFVEDYGDPIFWRLIDQEIGVQFWRKMNWMPEGKKLWSFIAPYKPDLLTSPSRDDTSRLGKNLWVSDHIVPPPKVIFAYSEDKQRYAAPNAILIDDKKSNIREWEEAGGIAIRCKDGNSDEVINTLIALGYE